MTEEEKKVLPGQYTMAEALVEAIEVCKSGFVETHEEVERARKAGWKKPDGSDWKFSWEK
jgi:hypothetical protein